MEPPLKRQKIQHENDDPFYGDRLSKHQHNKIIVRAFEGLSYDLATVIIKSLEFKNLGVCASVSKTFKQLSYHYLALKRFEKYSMVFTPENWNLSASLKSKFKKEECQKAFRSLTPTPNLTDYVYIYALKGLSIKNIRSFLKEVYPNPNGYYFMNIKVLEILGDVRVEKSCWIAVPRFSGGKFPKLVSDENILLTLKAIMGIYAECIKSKQGLIGSKFNKIGRLTINEKILSTQITPTPQGIKIYAYENDTRNYPYS
jgi:hypothetical protein